MQYKKILLIVNPKAGLSNFSRYNVFDIIVEFCENDCITTTFTTLKEGDATRLTEEYAKDYDMIVCSGGDGTLNETVSALMRKGINIPIGYIPSGSTNDMARTLEIPLKVKRAAKLIMSSDAKPFDVGKFCDDKYFCYTASFGAFTKVSYSTPRKLKNIFGHMAYIFKGISSAIEELVPINAKIEADGEIYEGEFILGGIFNAKSVGGLVRLDKSDVLLDDGKFELLLIKNPKNLDVLNKILNGLSKQKFDNEHIIMKKVSSAVFTFEDEVPWSLDGEFGGKTKRAEIKNLHNAISIIR